MSLSSFFSITPVTQIALLQDLKVSLNRIEFGAVGRQIAQGYIGRYFQDPGLVPTKLVKNQNSVLASMRGAFAQVLKVPVHLLRVDTIADMTDGIPRRRIDRCKQMAIAEALIAYDPGPRSRASPYPCQHAFLTDTRLILKPDVHTGRRGADGNDLLYQDAESVTKNVLSCLIRFRMNRLRRDNNLKPRE